VPPRSRATTAPPPLDDDDVVALRARLEAGEKPRVVVRAASAAVPAGTRGNVVRLGNPKEGEFVVVRLGRDEVPFAPAELGIAGRKPPPAPAPAPRRSRSSRKAPAAAKSAAARAKAAAPATEPIASRGRGKRAPARSRRSPQPLVVTLRFTDGGWTVEAQRGARRLARPAPVRPGAVKAFADLVDEGTVREALTETVESCRAVVEDRAAKLRAELHAAEATLKEYEARRR
jgi:hypothetical protein